MRPKEQLFCFFREIGCPHPTVVHPTGGSLRVFRQFAWLGVGSVKIALSRPTHQRVTPAVGRLAKVAAHLVRLMVLFSEVIRRVANELPS